MQNTVNLWTMLCEELETPQARQSGAEHVEAARKFEQVAKQVFKGKPDRLRDALEIAGDIHQAEDGAASARRLFEEALAVENAPAEQLARLATKLAMLDENLGDFAAARRHYEMAVTALEGSRDRSQLPTLLNNLASLQRQAGDFAAAEPTYQRALREAIALHGADHLEVAVITNNLAVAYTDHGDLVKAEDLHLRALQIRERTFGSHHPEVGQSLANLAAVYHAQNLPIKAERFYVSALEILGRFQSPDDPQIARIRANYEALPQVRARNLARTQRLK